MNDRELMQQALEALEDYRSGCQTKYDADKAITALRRALEQPAQQEPVAREHITDGGPCWCEPETNYTDPKTGVSVIVHKEPQ